jgi:Icc-related predicted phosphoesterase
VAEAEGFPYVKAQALALKSNIALLQGRQEDAARYARDSFGAAPSELQGRLAMALAAFGIGNPDEGIRILEEAYLESKCAPTGLSLQEIVDFNAWLGELPHPYKIVVAGNHDLLFEMDPEKARAQLTNAVYLENSGIMLGGISFWGSPITPVFPNWAFHVERGAASRKYWDRVPLGTDVLITHGPPYGTLDKRQILGSRFGCKDLIQAVLRVKPKLHVFGHVHGGYGQELGPNGTCMVNCAVVNEEYVLTNAPTVVSLE